MLVLRLGKMGKGEEGKVLKIVCPAMGPLPYGRGSVFLVSGRDSWTGNNDRVPGFAHSYQHPFPFSPFPPFPSFRIVAPSRDLAGVLSRLFVSFVLFVVSPFLSHPPRAFSTGCSPCSCRATAAPTKPANSG